MTESLVLINPVWPAPPHVKAISTTRVGGVSDTPYNALNLAAHVGDNPRNVAMNRALLCTRLGLVREPLWLNQVHGTGVADAARAEPGVDADASISRKAGSACAVLTADCLPILLCDCGGNEVAALHVGWRGLAAGIIEKTVAMLRTPSVNLLAWLGPAIGPSAFEVGSEVRDCFVAADRQATVAFVPGKNGHWQADIYALARLSLLRLGITAIYGGGRCTVAESEVFFSYRRDGVCGRMASVIWIADNH